MVWQMRVLDTHLYPGAQLLHSSTPKRRLKPGDILLIVFSDMSYTFAGVMTADGNQASIKVDSYRTQRGTLIAAKLWTIQNIDPFHGSHGYRVRRFFPDKWTPWKSKPITSSKAFSRKPMV